MRIIHSAFCALFALASVIPMFARTGILPAPGSVYREYTVEMTGNDWRVTDPDVEFERGEAFLPNPQLMIDGVDLDGAVRAEWVFDYWAGHPGTTNPRFRLNRHEWIPLIVELAGTDRPVLDYTAQLNLRMDVPLDHLQSGANTLQGSCDTNAWGWGQWGWYSATLRVYLAPDTREAPPIKVATDPGGFMTENPRISIAPPEPDSIGRVDYFARYSGIDENGDGVYDDFHGMRRGSDWQGHVGTATEAPWAVTWETDWVPDQPPGSIEIMALVQGTDGVWTATVALAGLSLARSGESVSLYTAEKAAPGFWVRNGQQDSCLVRLPDTFDPETVEEAVLFLRAWNVENNEEGHTPFRLNAGPWQDNVTGPGHSFHAAFYAIDPTLLQDGHNLLSYKSATEHHGCELLWPGPSILVRHTE